MGFFFFILANAVLFLRPSELIPDLKDAPLYEVCIAACLAVSLPRVAGRFSPQSLKANPIDACVVGLLVMILISGVANVGPGAALEAGITFFKVVLYYLLLVSLLDTEARLRRFVYYLTGLILALTTMALLQYHGFINNAALAAYAEKQDDGIDAATGNEGVVLLRLCAAGFYNNPNDVSRILVVGILLSLYGAGAPLSSVPRLLWLIPLGVFGYALALTHSRGGFLALLAGLMVFLCARFGGRKPIGLALIVLPLLFVVFKGRQTNLSTSEGTGHQRLQIWSEGFAEWKMRPLFGIGMGQHAEVLRIEAHNSFVHAYTELGLIGGSLFFGAFYLGLLLPQRAHKHAPGLPEGELRRFGPYVMGIIGGYMMGMMTSSRNYIPPTYTLLGLAAVYAQLAGAYLPSGVISLSGPLVRRIFLLGSLGIVALYLFVRLSIARG